MSLSAILEMIYQEGESAVRAIETKAQDEATRIIAEANSEAEVIRTEAEQQALMATSSEQARVLQQASLEALRLIGKAQSEITDRVLDEAREHLAGLRDSPDYQEVLRNLIREALEAITGSLREGESPCIHVDPRDRVLAERILSELSQTLDISADLVTWGGVRLTSADGRVTVDNTLESRLAEARTFLNRQLPLLLRSQ